MKRIFYNIACTGIAVIAVWATSSFKGAKANWLSNTFHFRLALSSGTPTGAQLTTTANWSTVPANFICTGADYVCVVTPTASANITTKAQLCAAIRANAKTFPSTWTVVKQAYQ